MQTYVKKIPYVLTVSLLLFLAFWLILGVFEMLPFKIPFDKAEYGNGPVGNGFGNGSGKGGGGTGSGGDTLKFTPSSKDMRVSPDRNDHYDKVRCYAVFNPYLGCLKRIYALDAVNNNYQLYIYNRSKQRIHTTNKDYPEVFTGKINITVKPGEYTPIPSVSPDAAILEYSSVPQRSLEFYKDGADNYYITAKKAGDLVLTYKMGTDRDYFTGDIPADATLNDIPGHIIREPPANVKKKAQEVIEKLGLEDENNVKAIVNKLSSYFSSFGCGDIPDKSAEPNDYLALALGEEGACRHRSYAFTVTANSIGLPTRYVFNEGHAFVEVYSHGIGWKRINLGGCGKYELINPEDKPPYNIPQEDSPDRNGSGGGGLKLTPEPTPTATEITAFDSLAYKGHSFNVSGLVTTEKGEPVEGMPIEIIISKEKNLSKDPIGKGVTGEDGKFEVQSDIPPNITVGDYHVIALSLGTEEYNQSNSDPLIKVKTRTNLSIKAPRLIIAGDRFKVRGSLNEETGNPIRNGNIVVKVDDNKISGVKTNNKGFFSDHFKLGTGNYTIKAIYEGTQYIQGSSASESVLIRELNLKTDVPEEKARGEIVKISGQVLAGNFGWGNETVAILYDGKVVTHVSCGEDGNFNGSYLIPENESLGEHALSFSIKRKGLTRHSTLYVKSTTSIETSYPDKVEKGKKVRINVTLFDDRGEPLSSRKVELAGYNSSEITDKNGKGVLVIYIPDDYSRDNLSANITFQGSKKYLPSQNPVFIEFEGHNFLFYIIPAFLAFSGLVYVTYKRKDKGLIKGNTEILSNLKNVKNQKIRSNSKSNSGFSINMFPREIPPGFPLVWGVGETLHIDFTASYLDSQVSKPLDVLVGNRPAETSYSGGVTTIELNLGDKGEYQITAMLEDRGKNIEKKCNLRIVNYREEVVRLYNQFLKETGMLSKNTKNKTSREVEFLLRRRYDHQSLATVRVCFEQAKYSLHSVDRRVYEEIYSSLKSMGLNL